MSRKLFTAAAGYNVKDLCHAASDHLVSSYCLFDAKSPRTLDSAGYLAHLAIELLLKAALLQLKAAFPDTHDLAALQRALEASGGSLRLSPESRSALFTLREFETLRYPHPRGLPSIIQADRRRIQRLFQELFDQMPSEVRSGIEFVDPTKKSRRVYARPPLAGSAARP